MEKYSKQFNDLECHFNWNIRAIVGEKDIVEKLCEKNEEIDGQIWRHLLINLTTAYELYVKNDSAATTKLHEAMLLWGDSNDEVIVKYKDAFRHILYSMKAFFYRNNSSDNIIKDILQYIPPYSTLPTEQKAAIIAIKAHVFSEYGTNGTKYALGLAKEAVKANPEEGEWSFLVGKMLSRIRQFTMDHNVSEEELECFRHAYSLSKSPAHAVFLAQIYTTISKSLFKVLPKFKGLRVMNSTEGRIINDYNEKAFKLYYEALRGNPDCVHTSFRCARGLLLLPGIFKDISYAMEIVEKNLERAPTNVFGNTVAANIYWATKQYDKAFKHAQLAVEGGSYGAAIKIINMKLDLKKEVDAIQEYENLMIIRPELMYKIQTCMHAMVYLIFKKRNIFHALDYFFKAVDFDATKDDFICYVYWLRDSTDVCFIIYNEVRATLEKRTTNNPKQLKKLRDAITIISSKYPEILNKKLQPNIVDILWKNFKINNPSRGKPNHRKRLEAKPARNKPDENNKVDGSNKKVGRRNKANSGGTGRSRSRTRTDSEGSNSSASSYASASSFTKVRRNSRHSALIDMVNKDLARLNLCEETKRLTESKDTSLRPTENVKTTVGFDPTIRRPLSMGCSGWKTKSSNGSTELNNSLLITSNTTSRSLTSIPVNNKQTDFRMARSSSAYPTNSRQDKTPGHSKYNKNMYQQNYSYNKGNFRGSVDINSLSSLTKKLSIGRASSLDKSKINSSDNNKVQIRKPFNLNRRESLDSDDNTSRSSVSPDRRSVSSVDSDYKNTNTKFPWNSRKTFFH